MESIEIPRKLWVHPNPKSTAMYRLMQEINQKHSLNLNARLAPILSSPTSITQTQQQICL